MNLFSDEDNRFMSVALQQADMALEHGNFPCGALLTIGGEIIGQERNEKESRKDRISHAEMLLYIKYSDVLKKAKKEEKLVTIYTTLEPCLMCFGAAIMHRVDRIVVACADPFGDMSKVEDNVLGEFYTTLPKLEYGLQYAESFALIKRHLEGQNSEEARHYLQLFAGTR